MASPSFEVSMDFDVVIIGAGAAGMMCAAEAAKRGRRALLLERSRSLGGKIIISGGGRCNFTNTGASPAQYVSENQHFCKSALSRYPAENFIELVKKHRIAFHEKKLGQLFCDISSKQIVQLLKSECDEAGVEIRLGYSVTEVNKLDTQFHIHTQCGTNREEFTCDSLVIATGGLSIPKLGATGFGYEVAQKFGLGLIETAPALDGFVFNNSESADFRKLAQEISGVSVDCIISCNKTSFRENILFTHAGLSGPAALQASLHWKEGDKIEINLLPEISAYEWLLQKKKEGCRLIVKNLLAEALPARLAELLCELHFPSRAPLNEIADKTLETFSNLLHRWTLFPSGTVGYSKAEVTRGGVDTNELSSKTMESKKVPGLYFIGEVVDVTGWLGGYNFQWAWSSGWCAGQVV